jgi:hypothetical protein
VANSRLREALAISSSQLLFMGTPDDPVPAKLYCTYSTNICGGINTVVAYYYLYFGKMPTRWGGVIEIPNPCMGRLRGQALIYKLLRLSDSRKNKLRLVDTRSLCVILMRRWKRKKNGRRDVPIHVLASEVEA